MAGIGCGALVVVKDEAFKCCLVMTYWIRHTNTQVADVLRGQGRRMTAAPFSYSG
jgi:hypothetical protein